MSGIPDDIEAETHSGHAARGDLPLGSGVKDPIIESRRCEECGYDLRGLEAGGRCPECGTQIASTVRVRNRDTLGDAAPEYLLVIGLGSLIAGVSGLLGFVVSLLGTWIFDTLAAGAVARTIIAAGWLSGVYLLLRQRPGSGSAREQDDRGREWHSLRMFVLVSQCFVIPATALVILTAYGWGSGWLWNSAFAFSALAVLSGWPALCYYTARLADWAPDDWLAGAFRGTGTMIVIGALVVLLVFLGTQIIALALISFLLAAAGIIFPFVCLFMMVLLILTAKMILWARMNAVDRFERDGRLFEMRRQRAEEMAARSMIATDSPLPPAADIDEVALRSVEEAAARAAVLSEEEERQVQMAASKQGHVLKRTSGDGPTSYQLENP